MSEANTKPQEKVGAVRQRSFFPVSLFWLLFGAQKSNKNNLLSKKVSNKEILHISKKIRIFAKKKIIMAKVIEKKGVAKGNKYGYIGEKLDLAFGKENYILMIIGFVVLFVGYLLMVGGSSTDPEVFNYDMFNTQRMVVAPLVLFLGFAIELVAIMKRPKD